MTERDGRTADSSSEAVPGSAAGKPDEAMWGGSRRTWGRVMAGQVLSVALLLAAAAAFWPLRGETVTPVLFLATVTFSLILLYLMSWRVVLILGYVRRITRERLLRQYEVGNYVFLCLYLATFVAWLVWGQKNTVGLVVTFLAVWKTIVAALVVGSRRGLPDSERGQVP